PSSTVPLIQAGRLRALAVTGSSRIAELPDVPTFSEAGFPLPEVDLGSWWGPLAPGKTPEPIIARLAAAFKTSIQDPDTHSKLEASGFVVDYRGPKEYTALIEKETLLWKEFI